MSNSYFDDLNFTPSLADGQMGAAAAVGGQRPDLQMDFSRFLLDSGSAENPSNQNDLMFANSAGGGQSRNFIVDSLAGTPTQGGVNYPGLRQNGFQNAPDWGSRFDPRINGLAPNSATWQQPGGLAPAPGPLWTDTPSANQSSVAVAPSNRMMVVENLNTSNQFPSRINTAFNSSSSSSDSRFAQFQPQQQQQQRVLPPSLPPTQQNTNVWSATSPDSQAQIDNSLFWTNPYPKKMAPPDKGTGLWGDPQHHATIEIKRWKITGDDLVDSRSQAALAAAAGSSMYNNQIQQQNSNANKNDVTNEQPSGETSMNKETNNQNVENKTLVTQNSMEQTGNDSEKNSDIIKSDMNSPVVETSSLRDEAQSSNLATDSSAKHRWGPVVSSSGEASPWSASAPQTDTNQSSSIVPGGRNSSSLNNTSSDSVFSPVNNESCALLKDSNVHLNFPPTAGNHHLMPQKSSTSFNNAQKDVDDRTEDYKLRLLSLVSRGYIEMSSLNKLYEQENTVMLLNNMMQICQQLDDLSARKQTLQLPAQKLAYDHMTTVEIPRLQSALQTLKEQIYAACNCNNVGGDSVSPKNNDSLWTSVPSDPVDQQNRQFFANTGQQQRLTDSGWPPDQTTQSSMMNQNMNPVNWSAGGAKPKTGLFDFGANSGGDALDAAFSGMNLTDQNNRFVNGHHTEFRPGTKWEPPRQQGGQWPQSTTARPTSFFDQQSGGSFGAFDSGRKIVSSGFDNGPLLGQGRQFGRPPSAAGVVPVFRPPPLQQPQMVAQQQRQQQLPWFLLSKINKTVAESHLKMFLNGYGRLQAFFYWQPTGFALFQFSDVPSIDTAQVMQQRLYSQGITLTLHKQAEAEALAENISSQQGRPFPIRAPFPPAGQSSFFDTMTSQPTNVGSSLWSQPQQQPQPDMYSFPPPAQPHASAGGDFSNFQPMNVGRNF